MGIGRQEVSNIDDALSFLLSPNGIRTRADQIYQLSLNGGTHFEVKESELDRVADFVLQIIDKNYPDRNVPYHSRWRHFEVGDQFQLKALQKHCTNLDNLTKAKLGLDLILPSVLVDAGAGPDWVYHSANSKVVGRSEGLGLASLDMFLDGGFSGSGKVESTAQGLCSVTVTDFEKYFKVTEANPLVGVDGRVQLLQNLGEAIKAQPEIFPNQRPGDLVDFLYQQHGLAPTAESVLQMVLKCLGGIWPGRLMLDNTNLGDTWAYAPLGNGPESYVPFHKLSQWVSYSIIETLDNNGFSVARVDALTGLAEYRNGGLLLDSGLINLRNPNEATTAWAPSSEIIIEWRALTICLLDKIAAKVVELLNTSSEQFPLAKVLEGGTWAAGRELAMQVRNNLTPPLNIESDATVF